MNTQGLHATLKSEFLAQDNRILRLQIFILYGYRVRRSLGREIIIAYGRSVATLYRRREENAFMLF